MLSHFPDEETEAQRGAMAHPKSHSHMCALWSVKAIADTTSGTTDI